MAPIHRPLRTNQGNRGLTGPTPTHTTTWSARLIEPLHLSLCHESLPGGRATPAAHPEPGCRGAVGAFILGPARPYPRQSNYHTGQQHFSPFTAGNRMRPTTRGRGSADSLNRNGRKTRLVILANTGVDGHHKNCRGCHSRRATLHPLSFENASAASTSTGNQPVQRPVPCSGYAQWPSCRRHEKRPVGGK